MNIQGKRKRSSGKVKFWKWMVNSFCLMVLLAIMAVAFVPYPQTHQLAPAPQRVVRYNIRIGDGDGAILHTQGENNLVRLRWLNISDLYSIRLEMLSPQTVFPLLYPAAMCGKTYCTVEMWLPDGEYVWTLYYISVNSSIQSYCCTAVDNFVLR